MQETEVTEAEIEDQTDDAPEESAAEKVADEDGEFSDWIER